MRSTGSPPGSPAAGVALATAVTLAFATTACTAATGDNQPHPEATQPPSGPKKHPDSRDPSASRGSPPDTTRSSAQPLRGTTIAIDPGHNGGNADAPERIDKQVPSGPGTKACNTVGAETEDGYPEHEFNWELAQVVRAQLEAAGSRVVLTREDDSGVGPCVNKRAEIANDAGADAALSIHADAGPPDGRGFHIIRPGEIDAYTVEAGIVGPSHRLAKDVRAALHEGADQPYADYIGHNGMDQRTDLGGLNLSEVPAVFVEAGNMRNAADAKKLKSEQWRKKAGRALASGITRYVTRD